MIALRRWSIRRRIVLVGVLPVLLAVLILTSYHMSEHWQSIKRQNDNVSSMILRHLALSAEYPVISGNVALLEPMITAALAQPSIVAVAILDSEGNELLRRQIAGYRSLAKQDVHPLYQDVIQEVSSLNEFSEFSSGGVSRRHLATIALEVSDAFSHAQQQNILQQSLSAGIGVLILTVFIAIAISTTIIPALEKLSEFISALAEGKLDQRIEVDDSAEIGQLQGNTNSLAESLANARQASQEYTRRLREEQGRAEAANQAKSRFLTMMSHELRTPLNGVSGALELLQPDQSSSDFEVYKSLAKSSLDQLTVILQDVLVIVDAEKGRLPVNVQKQRLPQMLEPLIQDYRKEALEQRLSFVVEYGSMLKDGKISVDPALIRQVVRHLLSNAMKFTESGYVVLKVDGRNRGAGALLTISVMDTGIGIPDDKRKLIFEAFTQVSTDFNRRYDGVGLGLTLVNHIVTILGGHITLGDGLEGGTSVVVELPIQAPESPVTSTRRVAESKESVLIVEDNRVNLMILKKMINKLFPGFTVDSVASGEACLERVASTSYGVILMDCQMPGMDGFEATTRLRALGETCPIIACTANASSDVHERCMSVGMNGFIGKPVDPDTLKAELKSWLTASETAH